MEGFGGLFTVVVAVVVECRTKRRKGVEQQLKEKYFIHWQQRINNNPKKVIVFQGTQCASKNVTFVCDQQFLSKNSNMRHQLIECNNFVFSITLYTFIRSFIQFLSHWNFNTSLINSLKIHLHIQSILLLTIHCWSLQIE